VFKLFHLRLLFLTFATGFSSAFCAISDQQMTSTKILDLDKKPSVDFNLDLLIWSVGVSGTDNFAQNIDTPLPSLGVSGIGNLQIFDSPYDLALGFRIGLGLDLDDYDIQASYTWFKTEANESIPYHANICSSFMGNYYFDNPASVGVDEPKYHSAKIKWNLDYNIFDLEFGKEYLASVHLVLRPFIGLKGGWINQKTNSYWYDQKEVKYLFSESIEDLSNNWWGIGPTFGLNSNWEFARLGSHSFCFFGDFSASFPLGSWRFSDVFENNLNQSVKIVLPNVFGGLTMIRGFLGLSWDYGSAFSKKKWGLKVGYETQIWLNMLRRYVFNTGRESNALSFNGATIDLVHKF
jgi:hypothetical protein